MGGLCQIMLNNLIFSLQLILISLDYLVQRVELEEVLGFQNATFAYLSAFQIKSFNFK